MDRIRKPFQGVGNIVRFNWQYYILSLVLVLSLFLFRKSFKGVFLLPVNILLILIICSSLVSLLVSYYIYDFSNLYKLNWLGNLQSADNEIIVNINAGFDETSLLLKNKFANARLLVYDFYEPAKHTEVSIKRARKAYPPYPGTQQVSTTHLPLQNDCAGKIFLILAAHEIRNDDERDSFFRELHRILAANGQIILTEHLRDAANFLAFNFGFFHFHSKATWLKNFRAAGLIVATQIKVTPFITTFILRKNGTEP